MVPLFVGYALLVWFFAGAHRRRLIGALSVVAGLLGLLALNWFHIQMGYWTRGEIYVPVLQTITYPYTVLVFAVGVFIWAIPRRVGERCGKCGYSLEGLEPVGSAIVCPECGHKHALRSAYRPSGADRRSFETNDDHANTADEFVRTVPRAQTRTGESRDGRGRWTRDGGDRAGGDADGPVVVRMPPERRPADRRPAGDRSAPEQPPEPPDREDREREPADERPLQRDEPVL